MTTDEDQLTLLLDELSRRQPAGATDGAWLTTRLRRRRVRQGVAGAAAVVLGIGAFTLALPDRRERAQLATDPPTASTTPSATAAPLQTVNPEATPPHTPVPPALTAPTGQQLVVVQGTKLELLDVDSGRRTPLATDSRLRGFDRIDVLWVNAQLVMLGDDNTGAGNGPTDVLATTAGPGSALRVIGQASYVLASDKPDRVWLVADVDNNDTPGSKLTEVDLRGKTHSSANFPQRFNVEPFAGGFLRSTLLPDGSDGNDTELVDAHGHVLHVYRGRVQAATPTTAVLYGGDLPCSGHCPIRVLTAGSPVQEREVTFTSLPYLTDSDLAPDGSRLFVNNAVSEDGPQPGRLTALDLLDGSQHVTDTAWTAPYWGPSMQFGLDGKWLFFADGNGKSIDALELATQRSYRVSGQFAAITGLGLMR